MKKLVVTLLAVAGLVVSALPVHAEDGAYTDTQVLHAETETGYSPDDICGDRAGWWTFALRTTVAHITELGDGYFTFHFTETGTYHIDFVDPAIPDQDSQFTGTDTVTLTYGDTYEESYTWHDFPTGIKIWERYSLHEVDGTPVLERYILKVTGCP
jgi:hypothetical protein